MFKIFLKFIQIIHYFLKLITWGQQDRELKKNLEHLETIRFRFLKRRFKKSIPEILLNRLETAS